VAGFFRLKARRGPRKAIMAVAASILTAVYFMLKDGTSYADLRADHFVRHDRVKETQRLLRKLALLDFEVGAVRDKKTAA
jgi:transposase